MSLTKQFEILRNGKEGDLDYEFALADVEVAMGDIEHTLSAIEQRIEQQAKRLAELEIRNSRKKRRFGI